MLETPFSVACQSKTRVKMQDDQRQQNSKNNEILSDSLKTSQQDVTVIEHSNECVEEKDGAAKSKPEMCGWALLKMAEDRKLLQQKESQETSQKGITQ